jgi:hypothetical protein
MLAQPNVAEVVATLDDLGLNGALGLVSGDRAALVALAAWMAPGDEAGSPIHPGQRDSASTGGSQVSAASAASVVESLKERIIEHFAQATSGGRTVRELSVFAALMAGDRWASAMSRARGLRLASGEIRRLERLWSARALWPAVVAVPGDMRPIHRLFRRNTDAGVDAILIELAQRSTTTEAATRAGQAALEAWFRRRDTILPHPLVDGRELVAVVGMAPGPWVGRTLDALEEAQASGEIQSRNQALALAIELARAD